jgi:hypothetical protein
MHDIEIKKIFQSNTKMLELYNFVSIINRRDTQNHNYQIGSQDID